jgi:hypothetical protein
MSIAGLVAPWAVAKGAWGRVEPSWGIGGASFGPAGAVRPNWTNHGVPGRTGQPRPDPACWVNHGQLWVKGGTN